VSLVVLRKTAIFSLEYFSLRPAHETYSPVSYVSLINFLFLLHILRLSLTCTSLVQQRSMPNTAHHSSSPGFVFFKHARLASIAHPPQPGLASLPERPDAVAAEHHRVAGAKGGHARMRGVVQEKVALARDRKASKQPASPRSGLRSQAVSSNHARSQTHHSTTRRTEPLTLHPRPILKAEVKRQAEIAGLSISATGTALLEWAVAQKLHMQQAATLESALEAIIDRKLRRRDDRLASLLIHNLLSSERTLILTTQLLNLTPGLTPNVVAQILDKAATDARRKVATRNPQLEEIITELREMLAAKEDEKEEKREPPKEG
jgi:hypothetical protein